MKNDNYKCFLSKVTLLQIQHTFDNDLLISKKMMGKYQTLKIPLGKYYVSTFQNLKISKFTVCLTRRPLDKRTTTHYYRTRPSKNFETVNLEIPNSEILKTLTLSKVGISCSDGLMNVAKGFFLCLIQHKLLLIFVILLQTL